ncbi:MAG: GtrA family protein [Clostridia bacterium]|nr:GtrA family protein [Clostridia bacterium]
MLSKLFENKLFRQIFNFGIVGGTSAVVDWGVLSFCVKVLNLNPILSNVISFIVSTVFGYWANAKFVFRFDESKGKLRLFIDFTALSALGLVVNEIVMLIGYNLLGYDPMIVKVFGIAFASVFNFISRKLVLESKEPKE